MSNDEYTETELDLIRAENSAAQWKSTATIAAQQRDEALQALEDFVLLLAAEQHDEPQPMSYHRFLEETVKPMIQRFRRP